MNRVAVALLAFMLSSIPLRALAAAEDPCFVSLEGTLKERHERAWQRENERAALEKRAVNLEMIFRTSPLFAEMASIETRPWSTKESAPLFIQQHGKEFTQRDAFAVLDWALRIDRETLALQIALERNWEIEDASLLQKMRDRAIASFENPMLFSLFLISEKTMSPEGIAGELSQDAARDQTPYDFLRKYGGLPEKTAIRKIFAVVSQTPIWPWLQSTRYAKFLKSLAGDEVEPGN